MENQQQNQEQTNQKANVDDQKKAKGNRAFRIGVIVNGCNYEDIKYYNEQFRKINKLYRDKITLVFFGYRPEDDVLNALEGVDFEYVKPVSIVHYYKQLNSLTIDLLFIPLIKNVFNTTSEDYKKYLEAGALRIPVIVSDVYPYNKLIKDTINGFVFPEREQFINYLKNLLATQLGLVRLCANHANKDVVENYNYSQKNMQIIANLFEMEESEDDEDDDNNDDEQNEEQNNEQGDEQNDGINPEFKEEK
jgi:hypothetical protein